MTARTLRIAALLLPPFAAVIALQLDDHRLMTGAAVILGVLWVALAITLIAILIAGERRTLADRASPASRIDVLTATGASITCGGAVAIVASGVLGWASLSVVGTLGIAAVYLAVIWSAAVAGGERPWRTAVITRAIVPARSVEGDPLREEIGVKGVTIPVGMRLFVLGRATRRGAISRYVVDSESSGGELALRSDLGAALRGDYRVPPLALWLGDVLGLTRTPVVHRGEAAFAVMPRVGKVDGVKRLLGPGGDDAISTPTTKLPTEGSFRIREYVPGDDARRIHWVRSLQQNQLVVRLPDEIPPAEPAVRLILDNDLFGTDSLTTSAPDELLDALVNVWLGIGKALADGGTRVTLVAAIEHDGTAKRHERPLYARGLQPGLQLGAAVTWQAAMPLGSLVEARGVKQIIISSRPRRPRLATEIAWVVVPEIAWTSREPELVKPSPTRLAFPLGSAENRRGRRKRERDRLTTQWNDRAMFSQVMCWTDWATFSGNLVAHRIQGRVALTVIP